MSTGEWVVAVVLILTLGAVLWYAWEARKQAAASVRMAEEMREQRLDLDRPYLLLEVRNLHAVEWKDLNDPSAAEPDPAAAYPKLVVYRVRNAGRGPAKEIATTLLQPLTVFDEPRRDVLMPGDFWHVEVTSSEAYRLLHEGTTGQEPLGMEGWMKAQGIHSAFYGAAYDCGLVAFCTDIHDRRWATYLKFGLLFTRELAPKVGTSRTLVPLEHRIVQLSGGDDA